MQQPKWDIYEAVILLDGYFDVLQKKLPKLRAVKHVSASLRQMAVNRGYVIDDVFRNENGISFQMQSMESAYLGTTTVKPATRLFEEIVEIYHTDKASYDAILKEAQAMIDKSTSIVDSFSDYLSSKVSPSKLSKIPYSEKTKTQSLQKAVSKKQVPASQPFKSGCSVTESTFYIYLHDVCHMADATCRGYTSNLRFCERYAAERGFETSRIFNASTDESGQTANNVLSDTDFMEYNKNQHNKFSAALSKLTDFFKASAGSSVSDTSVTPEAVQPDEASVVTKEEEERYTSILLDEFSNGLRQNVIHIKKFITRYTERYGSEPEVDRDTLLVQLKAVGTIWDDRIYARKSDNAGNGLFEKILDDVQLVFESGASCVFSEMLFSRFSYELAQEHNIFHKDAMVATLLENGSGSFYTADGMIFKKGISADYQTDVLRVLRASHTPLAYADLQNCLWYIPLDKIKQSLVGKPESVNVDTETYFYAPNLPISAEEMEKLIRAMNIDIEHRGFLVAQDLRKLLNSYCPSAAIDTADMKDYGLRNTLSYLLRDHFTFSGALITSHDVYMSISDAYHSFCRERETLSLSELKDFANSLGVVIYWSDVLQEMVRISPTSLIRKDHVHFQVEEADELLELHCPGDYIPIGDVGLFLQFPSAGVPWNAFVLESYVLQASRKFRMAQASISQSGVYGAIVRKSSPLQDYHDIIVDMLARTSGWEDEASALSLIVRKRYQERKRWSGFGKVIKETLLLREQINGKERG